MRNHYNLQLHSFRKRFKNFTCSLLQITAQKAERFIQYNYIISSFFQCIASNSQSKTSQVNNSATACVHWVYLSLCFLVQENKLSICFSSCNVKQYLESVLARKTSFKSKVYNVFNLKS